MTTIDGEKTSMEESLAHFSDDEMRINHIQGQLNELNQCVDDGGCYTCRPCNSLPKLNFLEFLLNFFTKEGYCTLDCKYFCMYPSEHY